MLKKWEEICKGRYSFSVDNKFAGKMDISPDCSDKTAKSIIGENLFTFKYVGFWKTLIEISDINGNLLVNAFYDNWYSSN